MRYDWLVLGLLAVWRVTHLLRYENGPWRSLARLRSYWDGAPFDCFYCLSLWVAAPLALMIGAGWPEWLLVWLGLSGGAILLDRVTDPEQAPIEAPVYSEDEEHEDGMLR